MAVNIPGDSRVITRGRVVIGPSSYGMTAEGGQVVQDVAISGITYRIHTFTNSGILTVTTGPTGTATIEYLMVGGGGGGGGWPATSAGGGGAGGYITGSITLLSSGEYEITVGTAGAVGTNGNNTIIGNSVQPTLLIAYGGGRGGTNGGAGNPGGSGGGGSSAQYSYPAGGLTLFSQGNNGGRSSLQYQPYLGGGGGGAGSAGSASPGGAGGNGGDAKETLIKGTPIWYAAGGGGTFSGTGGIGGSLILGGNGLGSANAPGINAAVQTGSGGGGGGGNGSDGIVIIRYRLN